MRPFDSDILGFIMGVQILTVKAAQPERCAGTWVQHRFPLHEYHGYNFVIRASSFSDYPCDPLFVVVLLSVNISVHSCRFVVKKRPYHA